MADREDEFLTIGAFGRRTGLTAKALRLYDDNGLLPPAAVDPASGYRFYTVDQVRPARLIAMLRGLDLGLDEIALVIADHDGDRDRAVARLGQHLDGLEAHHAGRRLLARHVESFLREDNQPMFTIHTRRVPAQRVMSIQRRLRAPQTDDFMAEAKAAFAQHLGERAPTGPFTMVFHGIVDHESDGPIEAILGCPDDVMPSEVIGIRTEPAHDEAFTTITKAQWDFPAILAAYDAVACSPEAVARPDSALSCREVYLAEPDQIGGHDLICDVAFPLGD